GNKTAFREIVERGPPPGLLAFDGDIAVGWCQLTPPDAFALAGSRMAAQAGGRCAGLVAVLLLCTQRLSQEGRHGGVDRSGFGCRKARECARARGLSP